MSILRVSYTVGAGVVAVALGACAGTGPSSVTPGTAAPASTSQNIAATRTISAAALGLARSGQSVVVNMVNPHRGWLSPKAATEKLVYVSDLHANAIVIYPQGKNNPSPVGEITEGISGPVRTFVDRSGTLYVTNAFNNTVTEYPAGSVSPSVTLSQNISFPLSVAVDRTGAVYVGEYNSNAVLEFPKGASSPTITLSVDQPVGLDTSKTRLYVGYNAVTNLDVLQCRLLSTKCNTLGLTTGVGYDVVGGVKVDSAGDLLVGAQDADTVYIYAPGTQSPARSIDISPHNPYSFALDKSNKNLYVADPGTGTVLVYDYATGVLNGLKTISSGLSSAYGVSVSPAQPLSKN